MKNAFDIVHDFEKALCEYTKAPYAVAVNSCTNALFLALKYHNSGLGHIIEIPSRTYISVPMQIKNAGFNVAFTDEQWQGCYQLKPFEIWDSARRFTSGMFNTRPILMSNSPYVCVSFHWSKILGIQQGGAILHNDPYFDDWARKARFDGRTEDVAPKNDKFDMLGWHMYMSPEIAAEGLVRLMHLPKNNPDLPNDDYPDLSQLEIFK
jgi:dTDP-4-amino-4,6-dideoxygalactose transaminase